MLKARFEVARASRARFLPQLFLRQVAYRLVSSSTAASYSITLSIWLTGSPTPITLHRGAGVARLPGRP